jgi:hypothetical protein
MLMGELWAILMMDDRNLPRFYCMTFDGNQGWERHPEGEMEEEEFVEWNRAKRARIFEYLEREGIAAPEIGEWPAFEMAPHFGIWCVESQQVKGKIGWWAFAGDCPTDYVSEDGQCHPRAALRNLLKAWRSYIPYMKNGTQPPGMKFGDGTNIRKLGELLERRVEIYQEWVEDDGLWEER